MPAPIGKSSVNTLENIQAVNVAFGFSFPNEVANKGRMKTCKDANSLNKLKCQMYVPLLKGVMFGGLLNGMTKKDPNPTDKALFARSLISEALGPILGTIVLLVVDIFFTILVKPFLNLAVWLHNKKVEREEKAKALETEAKKNAYFEKIDTKNSNSFMFHNPEASTANRGEGSSFNQRLF